jgi:catechol 2,3-dioxygenase-like lactoylglutathione lyase family enzyme
MTMRLSQIRLLVDDFAACRDFYRDVLGLELTLETEGEFYAQFIKEGVFLGLYKRQMMAAVVGTGGGDSRRAEQDTVLLGFEVDDVDHTVEALRAKGAEFVKGPQDQAEWFMRVAHLRDPDGNLIELFHALEMEQT